MREVTSPFVMCLTNTVAANFTANVLLAIGAKPAMIEEASEAAELASVADAILVNVGTLTPKQADVMRAALRLDSPPQPPPQPQPSTLTSTSRPPWVLDPVACHALTYRRAFVRELLAHHPTAIRGNRDEIDFLLRTSSSSLASIASLATGSVDVIRRGPEVVNEIAGGVPMLQQVTATGCAQGAIVAAFLGRGLAPIDALLAASKLMKRAGERAFARARTPGSFQIALLDALAELAPTVSAEEDARREA